MSKSTRRKQIFRRSVVITFAAGAASCATETRTPGGGPIGSGTLTPQNPAPIATMVAESPAPNVVVNPPPPITGPVAGVGGSGEAGSAGAAGSPPPNPIEDDAGI